jgi:hypothetical protein
MLMFPVRYIYTVSKTAISSARDGSTYFLLASQIIRLKGRQSLTVSIAAPHRHGGYNILCGNARDIDASV